MLDLGIVKPGSTIRIPFSSFDKDDGSSITMTNFAVGDILIYKDGSTTERASTSGFTATTDFDSKTGKHLAIIDLADNTTADFFAAGSEYHVAIDSVTVDTVTVGGWVARFRIGYQGAILDTTIATLSSQTSFTLTSGPAEDDALNGRQVIIHDAASAVQLGSALILDYTGSTKTVTLVAGTTFTVAAKDNISVMDLAPLQPTALGRTLDVSATGEAGVDWANVGSPTTTLNLSGTTIATTQKVDVETIKTRTVTCAAAVTVYPAVGMTAAACANVEVVFVTDFATNYNTTLDRWSVSVAQFADGTALTTNAGTNAYTFFHCGGDPSTVEVTWIDAFVSSRMATYTQPTGFLAATFPATIASTTNITAGTITTATNLTNLPTIPANWLTAAGTAADFTTEIQTGLATAAAVATLQTYVDTEVASILAAVDTEIGDIQSRLPATLTGDGNMKCDALRIGGTLQTGADLAESITVVDDAVARLSGLAGYVRNANFGTVGNDTTHIHLEGLTCGDDEINDMLLVIYDTSTQEYHSRWIADWVLSTELATVATLPFTPDGTADRVWLFAIRRDVTGSGGLDAAGVRAAIGLASANLDTQLGDLPTNAELATSQAAADDATLAAIAAIDTKIDTLDNFVDTEIGAIITTLGTPAGASLAADLVVIDDFVDALESRLTSSRAGYLDNLSAGAVATAASITALNNLSAAQVASELATYDAPTNAEMVARTLAAASYATAANQTSILSAIDAVDNFVDTEIAAIQTTLAALFTTAISEPTYRTDGAAGSLAQLIYEINQTIGERSFSGTTATVKKIDGSTTAFTQTIDHAEAQRDNQRGRSPRAEAQTQ